MSKILEDFNLKNHGNYDISILKDYLSIFNNEWLLDTSRQDNFETHKETNSYFLYKASLGWQKDQPFNVLKESQDAELFNMVEPIIADLEKIHDGVRGNVLFIKLKANKEIPSHQDGGTYLINSRRHHIPIVTSDQTYFTVGSERINMNAGECWEINNTRFHSVENNSGIDRIHLLIDIMPNKEIGMK